MKPKQAIAEIEQEDNVPWSNNVKSVIAFVITTMILIYPLPFPSLVMTPLSGVKHALFFGGIYGATYLLALDGMRARPRTFKALAILSLVGLNFLLVVLFVGGCLHWEEVQVYWRYQFVFVLD